MILNLKVQCHVHDLDETVKFLWRLLCGMVCGEVSSKKAFDEVYMFCLVLVLNVSECPAEEFRAKGTACPLDFGFNGGPMAPVSECEEGLKGSSDLQEGATSC